MIKRFFFLAIGAVSLIGSAASAANITDSEGYPIVFLRGDMSETGWAVNDNYKFTRSGNTYSLAITTSNPLEAGCSFKIATEDWNTVDYGAQIDITGTMTADLRKAGGNMSTSSGLSNGTISFTLEKSNLYPENLTVTFDFGKANVADPLPVMYINVYTDENHTSLNNEIIDKDLSHKNYFDYAVYWIDTNGCEWMEAEGATSVGSADSPLDLQIKARGNYTRTGFSKKPFKIKLGKKQNLLGMTPEKSKHYALLAHADDTYGFIRNFIMFDLGKRIGLPWTPSQQPVRLFINGSDRGLYFLTESIRIGDGRIDIEELDDNEVDQALISGGYVVELDNYDESDDAQIRMEERTCASGWHYTDMLRITFDTPEQYSSLQRQFVTEQFTAMNNAIGDNSDDIWKYLDLDDAARYYIVMEILSHVESFHGSTYLFRDRGEGQKWHFSPLWDGGNVFSGNADAYLYNCDPFGNTWIPSLRENATFNQKVKDTWLWFMSNCYEGVIEDVNEYVSHIAAAAKDDHDIWKNRSLPNSGNATPVANNSDINTNKNYGISKLHSKIDWLKGRTWFGDYTTSTFTEPERDLTEAAPLPDYATTFLNLVTDDNDSAEPEYFNLQGMKVNNPQKGQIYIVRCGSKTTKVIF